MYQELESLGIELKGRKVGQFKTTCPKCSEERKKKKDPCLSVNIDTGVFSCHNCGWKGGVKIDKVEKKAYSVPVVNNTQLSDKALAWFTDTRKISKATVMRFGISEGSEYMPQEQKPVKTIQFNYLRDNNLVNVKFRDAKKNFKLVSGAELIFYGLDLIKDCDTATICEGEIDALSFYEAGISQVVSVPNGASKGNQKLEYLDNCYSYFADKKKIIIATDSDEAGMILRDELCRRLGKERCFVVKYPEGCKDANEVLVKFGTKEVRQLIENAKEFPLEGIKTVEDFEKAIDYIYENGYPQGEKIGYNEFDKLLSFRKGEFTVITGIPNSGKSEFADQIKVKLSQLHKWRWGVFSAENQPEELHFVKLAEKFIGKAFYSFNDDIRMTPEEGLRAKSFVNDHFFFIMMNDENVTLDGLLSKARELVLRKGINGLLIDPWNYIEHKIPHGYSETQYISEALTKISRFAKINNVHIIVVAHPTKIGKNEDHKYKVATMYDIAGSANWFNKPDNGMSVYLDFETKEVTVYVQKVRFKFIGKKGEAKFTWDYDSGRYSEIGQKTFNNFND